jgi:hypothetical protein
MPEPDDSWFEWEPLIEPLLAWLEERGLPFKKDPMAALRVRVKGPDGNLHPAATWGDLRLKPWAEPLWPMERAYYETVLPTEHLRAAAEAFGIENLEFAFEEADDA